MRFGTRLGFDTRIGIRFRNMGSESSVKSGVRIPFWDKGQVWNLRPTFELGFKIGVVIFQDVDWVGIQEEGRGRGQVSRQG